MNSEQNVVNTEPYQEHQDTSGLVEIQQALEEIEKLQNNQEEEIEEPEEEEQAEKVAEEENNNEKHEKKESKLWKEKKRKYQAIAEKEALFQENVQLKQMLSESLNSGTYHYGKSAYADLERAKDNKKKAIEEGDLDSLLEADISLTKAIHTINDLEKWAYTEEQRRPKTTGYINDEEQSGNVNARVSERETEIVRDWLEDHPYLEPSSSKYDSKTANKVADFVNALDVNLTNSGNRDVLFSDQYFDHIDDYIAKIRQETSKNSKSLNSMAPVGAVRNSYTSSVNGKASSPTQIILTADEKRMCANSGISEKEWLKYKLEDLKKGK